MVEQGIGRMLVSLSEPSDDHDLTRRVSGSYRNLLLVNENHIRLVEDGVIQAIVHLFNTQDTLTKQHCASALRNVTYNQNFRRLLVDSGAIAVIIEDSKMEDEDDDDYDLPININLLFEMEAESWSNGNRGRQREGRAPPHANLPISNTHLATCSCLKFTEDVEHYSPWYKLTSTLQQATEPPLDLTAEFSASSFGSLVNLKIGRDAEIDFKTYTLVTGKIASPHLLPLGPTPLFADINNASSTAAPQERKSMAPSTSLNSTMNISVSNPPVDGSTTTTTTTTTKEVKRKKTVEMESPRTGRPPEGKDLGATTATFASTTSTLALATTTATLPPSINNEATSNLGALLSKAVVEENNEPAPPQQITFSTTNVSTAGWGSNANDDSSGAMSEENQRWPSGIQISQRDRQIDSLIRSFKRASTIEDLLSQHNNKSPKKMGAPKRSMGSMLPDRKHSLGTEDIVAQAPPPEMADNANGFIPKTAPT